MQVEDSSRPARRTRGLTLLMLSCSLSALTPTAAAQTENRVDTTRAVFAEWADASRKIAKAKAEWQLGKEMLTDRIALLKQQIAAIEAKTAEADKSLIEVNKKTAKLEQDREALRSVSKMLGEQVAPLEERVFALIPLLPAPAAEEVRIFSKRLPGSLAKAQADAVAKAKAEGKKAPAATATKKQSVSSRYQNVVAVMLGLNKFHRDLKLTNEMRTLSDGKKAVVATLYVGLGHAYYVNAKGDRAGLGSRGEKGWTWTTADDAATQIAAAIAIYQNKQGAAFVSLPIRIQ